MDLEVFSVVAGNRYYFQPVLVLGSITSNIWVVLSSALSSIIFSQICTD